MKKSFSVVICALLSCAIFPSIAFSQGFVYTDASSLPLFGQLGKDTFEPYSRLPLSMKDSVRDAVWRLGRSGYL